MGIPNGGRGGTVIQTTSMMAFSNTFRNIPMFKSTKKYVIEFTKRFGVSVPGILFRTYLINM